MVYSGELKRFTIKIRRGAEGEVRPEAEQLDGKSYLFRYGFAMAGDDIYPHEVAWFPEDGAYPLGGPPWIASGDLSVPWSSRAINHRRK